MRKQIECGSWQGATTYGVEFSIMCGTFGITSLEPILSAWRPYVSTTCHDIFHNMLILKMSQSPSLTNLKENTNMLDV